MGEHRRSAFAHYEQEMVGLTHKLKSVEGLPNKPKTCRADFCKASFTLQDNDDLDIDGNPVIAHTSDLSTLFTDAANDDNADNDATLHAEMQAMHKQAHYAHLAFSFNKSAYEAALAEAMTRDLPRIMGMARHLEDVRRKYYAMRRRSRFGLSL